MTRLYNDSVYDGEAVNRHGDTGHIMICNGVRYVVHDDGRCNTNKVTVFDIIKRKEDERV